MIQKLQAIAVMFVGSPSDSVKYADCHGRSSTLLGIRRMTQMGYKSVVKRDVTHKDKETSWLG